MEFAILTCFPLESYYLIHNILIIIVRSVSKCNIAKLIIFLDNTKLKIVWVKITFFKRRVSIIL